MGKFIIRSVPSGLKFDLMAANGQSILTSEVYTSEAACQKGIRSVRKNAAAAKVEDQTQAAWAGKTNPKFELYRGRAGDFRFRLKARNGEIIGISGSYSSRAACINGLESVRKNAPEASVEAEQTLLP